MEKRRIFIIDDDNNLTNILKDFFDKYGVTSYIYSEPPNLEKDLAEKHPHTVLLDIVLPDTSGIAVLGQIKRINPNLPVIMMTGFADAQKNIECLKQGAYAFLTKPFKGYDELYHTVNNAITYYTEFLKTSALTEEIGKQHEAEKLNLMELNFLKTLHHMIGEAGDTAFVLKNFFTILKTFIPFDIFATLIQEDDEIVIQLFPNIKASKKLINFVTNTLSERMADTAPGERQAKVIMNEGEAVSPSAKKDFKYIISDLSTQSRIYGHTGLFRASPFALKEEAIFNRFCSHISLTLEKIRLFNEIKALSIHDGLTGVYNHAFSVKALEEEVERSKRYGSHLTIVLFDIDDFKTINDTHGHPAGDYILKQVAEILKSGLRSIDIIGRYGGEEFLVILPETFSDQGFLVSDRLRRDIENEHFIYEGEDIRITVSGGVAQYVPGVEAKTIIKRADDNMYKAKSEGKNRIYL